MAQKSSLPLGQSSWQPLMLSPIVCHRRHDPMSADHQPVTVRYVFLLLRNFNPTLPTLSSILTLQWGRLTKDWPIPNTAEFNHSRCSTITVELFINNSAKISRAGGPMDIHP